MMFELESNIVNKNTALEARCYGRFFYTHESVSDSPELIQKIWARVIPIKVDYNFAYRMFEIVAMSTEFEPIEENQQIPEYKVLVHRSVNKKTKKQSYRLTFQKVEE